MSVFENPPQALQVESSTFGSTASMSQSGVYSGSAPTDAPKEALQRFEDLEEFDANSSTVMVRKTQYLRGKVLGKGKFSEVFRAKNTSTNEIVALKIQYLDSKDRRMVMTTIQQLRAELKALKDVSHENVVRLIGYDPQTACKSKTETETVKRPCMICVQELCGAGELFHYISYGEKFPTNIARHVFKQFINGLEACHSRGIAHRDLKPDNLFLTKDFTLKIGDFGFAKRFREKTRQGVGSRLAMDTPLGTPGYMAPEVLARCMYDERSDIFSSGIILFIMLAGYPPLKRAQVGDWWFDRLANRNYSRFWEAHERDKCFSAPVKEVINKMLAIRPKERWNIRNIKTSSFWNASAEECVTREQYIGYFNKLKYTMDQKKMSDESKQHRDPETIRIKGFVKSFPETQPLLLKHFLKRYLRDELLGVSTTEELDFWLAMVAEEGPEYAAIGNASLKNEVEVGEAVQLLLQADSVSDVEKVLIIDANAAGFLLEALQKTMVTVRKNIMDDDYIRKLCELGERSLDSLDELDTTNITTYELRCGFDTVNFALREYVKVEVKGGQLLIVPEQAMNLVKVPVESSLPLPFGVSEEERQKNTTKENLKIEVRCFQKPGTTNTLCRVKKLDPSYETTKAFREFCNNLFFKDTILACCLANTESTTDVQ